jgi:hypothetical protein
MTVALLAALLNATGKCLETEQSGALALWQVRIAKDYLEENFSREISLKRANSE